jgi:hypothetical protein
MNLHSYWQGCRILQRIATLQSIEGLWNNPEPSVLRIRR